MSLILSTLRVLDALQISSLTFVSYLLFYTMYDKKTKELELSSLTDVLIFQKGIDHTLVEINKAISLSGLSVLCLAFLPIFQKEMYNLLLSGMIQLCIHTVYSTYKYYGGKNLPYLSTFIYIKDQWTKKMSIIFGLMAHIVLLIGFMGYYGLALSSLLAIVLGMLHFYLMEIDYKFILRVRPFALVVFPLSIAALVYGLNL